MEKNRIYTVLRENETVIENYKGYLITSSYSGECLQVLDLKNDSRFIVGMDDSKSCGYRTFVKSTVQDARNYIDWLTKDEYIKKCCATCNHNNCCFLSLICIPYDYKHYNHK